MNDDDFARASEAYDHADYDLAFKLFLQGAEDGHSGAMERVAIMYTCGEGIACDYDKALEWEKKAIQHGSLSALLNIGITYRIKGDMLCARKWFEKSFDLGDGEAAMELARLYMVSDKEIETVIRYLKLAIENQRTCEATKKEATKTLQNLSKQRKPINK
ncbi:MAG: sel1 repeat family protein [Candidatus Thiodiazotropha sp. (ex Epidulcina cf. delphinae)]|nr:sel1 repeat family protein [Candidatus Thiodiazotropha sp. (ex Epidulcina cf. delphinae)]